MLHVGAGEECVARGGGGRVCCKNDDSVETHIRAFSLFLLPLSPSPPMASPGPRRRDVDPEDGRREGVSAPAPRSAQRGSASPARRRAAASAPPARCRAWHMGLLVVTVACGTVGEWRRERSGRGLRAADFIPRSTNPSSSLSRPPPRPRRRRVQVRQREGFTQLKTRKKHRAHPVSPPSATPAALPPQ